MEEEITITRELAYDIIKRVVDLSNEYDRKVFQVLSKLGLDYENNTQFDHALKQIENKTLETLLLLI